MIKQYSFLYNNDLFIFNSINININSIFKNFKYYEYYEH